MRAHKSRTLALIAAVGLAAALTPLGNTAPRDTAFPTLYVQYTMNCTFTIVDDSGNPVTAIPPGTYQVEVSTPIMFRLVNIPDRAPNDFTGCKGWVQFQLTGPGVNLGTTLDIGCESDYLLPATSFKPNSTYTAQDLNNPAGAHASITTLSSGSPTLPTNPSGTGTGKGTASTDIVGEGITAGIRGVVTGTLSPSGIARLTSGGRAVATIKAGRYRFTITDRSPHAGFTLQAPKSAVPKALTGKGFVGRHSTTLALTAGRWTYVSGGKKASLVVTA